jgi:hypothetical protein
VCEFGSNLGSKPRLVGLAQRQRAAMCEVA